MMILIERKTPTGNKVYEDLEKKQQLFEQFNCRYLEDKPINTCFGIDCYQIDNNIVEEKEYAKSKV